MTALGIDLGGTKIMAVRVDGEGVRGRKWCETRVSDGDVVEVGRAVGGG